MSISGFIAALRKTDKAWKKSYERLKIRLIRFNKLWPHGVQRTLYAKTLGYCVCVCVHPIKMHLLFLLSRSVYVEWPGSDINAPQCYSVKTT